MQQCGGVVGDSLVWKVEAKELDTEKEGERGREREREREREYIALLCHSFALCFAVVVSCICLFWRDTLCYCEAIILLPS